jgi:hypothetical protein
MTSISLVAALIFVGMPSADQAPRRASYVRSSNAEVTALLDRGYERSATFRSLVDALDTARVLVYVEPAVRLPDDREGELLHVVLGSSDVPMVRVLVRNGFGDVYRIGVIAHELQHVLEAVEGGGLTSAAAMTATFARLDHSQTRGGDPFDTEAARDAQARVLRELRMSEKAHSKIRRQRIVEAPGIRS